MVTKKAVSLANKKNSAPSRVSVWKRTQTAEGWKRSRLKMRQSKKGVKRNP